MRSCCGHRLFTTTTNCRWDVRRPPSEARPTDEPHNHAATDSQIQGQRSGAISGTRRATLARWHGLSPHIAPQRSINRGNRGIQTSHCLAWSSSNMVGRRIDGATHRHGCNQHARRRINSPMRRRTTFQARTAQLEILLVEVSLLGVCNRLPQLPREQIEVVLVRPFIRNDGEQ